MATAIQRTTLQQQHLVRNNLVDKCRTGQVWTVQIICTIWRHWYEVWEIRNQVIHGKDKSTRHQARRQRLKFQLEKLCALRNNVCARHRNKFFEHDIETHLRKSNNQLDNWIRINSGPIQASIKQAKIQARNSVRAIETYFRQVNTTRNQPPLHQRQPRSRNNPTAAQRNPTAPARTRSSRRPQPNTNNQRQRTRTTRQRNSTSRQRPTTNNQRPQQRTHPQRHATARRTTKKTQQAIHSFFRPTR